MENLFAEDKWSAMEKTQRADDSMKEWVPDRDQVLRAINNLDAAIKGKAYAIEAVYTALNLIHKDYDMTYTEALNG
jgi:hypothetical protein